LSHVVRDKSGRSRRRGWTNATNTTKATKATNGSRRSITNGTDEAAKSSTALHIFIRGGFIAYASLTTAFGTLVR
jgi:hypothetical protein